MISMYFADDYSAMFDVLFIAVWAISDWASSSLSGLRQFPHVNTDSFFKGGHSWFNTSVTSRSGHAVSKANT